MCVHIHNITIFLFPPSKFTTGSRSHVMWLFFGVEFGQVPFLCSVTRYPFWQHEHGHGPRCLAPLVPGVQKTLQIRIDTLVSYLVLCKKDVYRGLVRWQRSMLVRRCFGRGTLPETNTASENRPGPKRKFIFQPLIFRGYLSLPECNSCSILHFSGEYPKKCKKQ